MMELPKLPLWYGHPGIEFIHHGAWADPELRYKHRTFNYWCVDQMCYDDYKELGVEMDFDDWMVANPNVAYENLEILIAEDDATIEDWRYDPLKPEEKWGMFDYLANTIMNSGYEIKTGLSNLMVMMILHFECWQEEVDFMEAHIDSPEEWAQAIIDEVEASGGFREFDYWC